MPKSPIDRPNARRSCTRSIAIFTSADPRPTQPTARLKRPLLSTSIATLKPLPTSPSTFSRGTRTSSKKTSVVEVPRMPSLFSLGPDVTPLPRSTRNAVIFGLRPSSAGEVRANTVKTSAKPPFVIQILEPFRR